MIAGGKAANTGTFKVSTPSDRQILMTRFFDAPRHLVFEAMTRPEHVKQWWGNLGKGYSVPVCEIDFRVGGKWRFVNRHPRGDAEFYGEYLEIDAPARLVFTEIFAQFPDTVSTVATDLIEEDGGLKTRMSVIIIYPSIDVRDMVLATGMSSGAGISYDRLEDLVVAMQL